MMAPDSPNNAFYFYTGIGMPLEKSAMDLRQFYETLRTIDIQSLEFHLFREDFEKWLNYCGEDRLSSEVAKVRRSGQMGEPLRVTLRNIVNKYLTK
jgi:hypothetical protein